MSPLHYAAKNGHLELVELLLEYKADINLANSFGWSSLYHAVKNGHLNIVAVLLENKADIILEGGIKLVEGLLKNSYFTMQLEEAM
ncbi:hypothetical protein C0992_004011 [Termitomyces sp. T32_za158]|nr:hypothetical protein C0992_004011 [Termitomyces sp. T32_za158]